jgi:Putative beta-barrel porin 2
MRIRTTFLAAAGIALSGAALAQSGDRTWYVGLVQDFARESNPLGLPPGSSEPSDNISTTTLRGGLNLPFGRQRAYANAVLGYERYNEFSERNNNGYAIGAGLDWATVERLSGNVALNANQQQSDFIVGGVVPVTVSNIERSEDLNARVRLGVVTAMGFDASLGTRQVSFSEPEFASREYKQDNASLGISYRTSGILSLGAGLRGERTRYRNAAPGQTEPDQSDRQDFYIAADWVPTGASTVNARLFFGKIEYKLATAADFDGVAGSLVWAWQPTGLLNLRTTLSRDSGLDSGYLRLDESGTVSATDFSQVTNALTLRADYLVTGKVTLTGGIGYAKRDFVNGFTGATGTDDTTTVSLGARWAATRTLAFGCNARRESRSASGFGSSAYDNDRFGCFGQIGLD